MSQEGKAKTLLDGAILLEPQQCFRLFDEPCDSREAAAALTGRDNPAVLDHENIGRVCFRHKAIDI